MRTFTPGRITAKGASSFANGWRRRLDFASLNPGDGLYPIAMLSRRHLLVSSGCTLAAIATRAPAVDTPGTTVLHAGKDGFNGAIPGPAIRARRGDEIRVRLVNDLDEPTALCWHGVRAANPMDGSASQSMVAPGASFEYRFTVRDAGTFFYRAGRRTQQDAGLYGALIVAEPAPPPVDQDHVLIFDGRQTRNDAARRYTINGATSLDISVRANERLRLRFINATTAQAMNARVENHRVMVMALDGEPSEPFASSEGRIVLGPGNRADVFIDATLGPNRVAPIVFTPEGGEPPAVRLVYGDAPARGTAAGEPAPLPANPLPERMNFPRALRVTLPIERAGAAPVQPPRALFTAERGRTVVMALDNRDDGPHVVHLRGHHFRLLDRLDDGWKPYWLDTVPVAGRQTARIAFVADNPGRWLIENRALNASGDSESWFEVR
jgi:FtsP/CotA-like multicopper oxidase with cupredoxin domain